MLTAVSWSKMKVSTHQVIQSGMMVIIPVTR